MNARKPEQPNSSNATQEEAVSIDNSNATQDNTFSKNNSPSGSFANFFKENCTREQLQGHVILGINTLFFSLWHVFAKFALNKFNPVVFTWFRSSLTWLFILPVMIIVDRNYSFNLSNETIRTQSTELQLVEDNDQQKDVLNTAPQDNTSTNNNPNTPILQEDTSNRSFQNSISSSSCLLFLNFIKSQFVKRVPSRKPFVLLLFSGILLVCVNNLLFAIGLALTDAVIASIIGLSASIFTSLIALVLKTEKQSLLKYIGIAVSILGATITTLLNSYTSNSSNTGTGSILGNLSFNWKYLLGIFLFLVNNFAWALSFSLQKKCMSIECGSVPLTTVTFWSFFLGCLFLTVPFLYYVLFEFSANILNISIYAWAAVFYSGTVAGALGFLFQNYGSAKLGPTLVAIYNTVRPFTNSVFSYFILKTEINYLIFIGAGIIITGVIITSVARAKYG